MSVRTVAAADTSFLLREQGSGHGTPVLLLHGVPETSSCWNRLLPRLADGRRVLAPDLPGLGGSGYGGPYDVGSLVTQLAALIDAEVGGPVDVVGHDWGGVLALGLAGARPELVRRLAVANAPYRSVPLRAVHLPLFSLPVAPELLFRLGGRRAVRLLLGLGWRSTTPLDPEVRAEYEAAYTRRSSVTAMLGYYRAAVRPRIASAVRREQPPPQPRVRAERMLVLWGARDPALPVSTGERVVKDLGPDCVMVTVPGAGHFVIEEAPDVIADVLLDFLAERGEPTTSAAPPEGPERPRVAAEEPEETDVAEVPSVGLVPVGGTPEEQEAHASARAVPGGRGSAAKKAPASKPAAAAKQAPAARQAAAGKKAPAAKQAAAGKQAPPAKKQAPPAKQAAAAKEAPAAKQGPAVKAPAAKKSAAAGKKAPPAGKAPATDRPRAAKAPGSAVEGAATRPARRAGRPAPPEAPRFSGSS